MCCGLRDGSFMKNQARNPHSTSQFLQDTAENRILEGSSTHRTTCCWLSVRAATDDRNTQSQEKSVFITRHGRSCLAPGRLEMRHSIRSRVDRGILNDGFVHQNCKHCSASIPTEPRRAVSTLLHEEKFPKLAAYPS